MQKITHEDLPKLFNEWMRRFTEKPEEFEAQYRTITRFLAEKAGGEEPSYGEVCTIYLTNLKKELIGPRS